jgi:UDP:flavonoid glycosyltransferase YjiC (YdhE family)
LGQAELPDTVYLLDYAPYEWLFPRMASIVHHGGSGTTAQALRSGRPSLILPSVFDQYYWGKRIAFLEVGPEPIPIGRLMGRRSGSDYLQSAVEQATQDEDMEQRASDLGRRIKAEDGLGKAIEIIEGQVTIT